jgi:hypothetical protein
MTTVSPTCAHRGPLEELLGHLHGDGEVPDAWVAAHAPGGSLEAVWSDCDDVCALVDLAALTVDRPTLVRAACACARMVVKHLPPERQAEADAALETAERWARGEVDLEALADAADATDHTYANEEPSVPLVACAAAAVGAAVATAATAGGYETRWYDRRQGEEAANHAALCAAGALWWAAPNRDVGDAQVKPDRSPLVATVLRAHLPCPTLDELRRGLEEMLAREAAEHT